MITSHPFLSAFLALLVLDALLFIICADIRIAPVKRWFACINLHWLLITGIRKLFSRKSLKADVGTLPEPVQLKVYRDAAEHYQRQLFQALKLLEDARTCVAGPFIKQRISGFLSKYNR